jgi:pimeloyl-ACP methyl ester carboxylesterase
MFIERYGEGPRAFLFLHGWNGDHRSFAPVLPHVPPDATLYAADLPGCGASVPPRHPDLRSVTRDLVHAFDAIGQPFTLIGHCTGALLGMHAALERTALLQRLVLIDTFAKWPWYFRAFTNPVFGRYAYATTFANPIGRWLSNQALAARRTGESDLTEGFARTSHAMNRQYLHIIAELESAAQFAPLNVPVDIVFGSRTFQAVRTSAADWQHIWPECRIWELPRAGHLVLREASQALGQIIFQGDLCQPQTALTSNTAHS